MKCIVCGAENPQSASFCRTCGSPIDNSQQNTETNSQQNPNNESPNFQSSTENEIAYPWGEYPVEYADEPQNQQNQNHRTQQYSEVDRAPYEPTPHDYHHKPTEPAKKKSGKGLVVLLISLIVILVGTLSVVGYKIWDKHYNETSEIIINDNELPDSTETPKPTTVDPAEQEAEPEPEPEPELELEPVKISTYRAIKEDVTWDEANRRAKSSGGHLVCINSYDEYVEVRETAEHAGIICCWLGANLMGYSDWNDVTWADGTSFESGYNLWHDGEPSYVDNNLNISEHYLMLSKWDGIWKLNDVPINAADYLSPNTVGYIIEFEEEIFE